MNPLLKLAAAIIAGALLVTLPFAVVLPAAALLLTAALVALRPAQRQVLLLIHFSSLTVGGAIYALAVPGDPALQIGPATFSGPGFLLGLRATTRLVALFSLFALTSHVLPARELLPYVSRRPLPLYVLGATLRLVPILRQDAERIREAQAARGHAFQRGLRGLRSWTTLLVPLMVATLRRTRDQALALRLAHLAPSHAAGDPRRALQWALVPTLAALAVAGRLALVSIPNVSLSFFVVFIAGVAYGPRIGALVGLLSRLASDFLLTGLHPIFLAMAPVEAFLGGFAGLLGALVNLGQRAREPWIHATTLAGTLGWIYTFAFSIAADTATWLLFSVLAPGLPGNTPGVLWTSLVLSGLLFNIPSALFNAAFFGLATYPVLRALRAADLVPLFEPAPRRSAAP